MLPFNLSLLLSGASALPHSAPASGLEPGSSLDTTPHVERMKRQTKPSAWHADDAESLHSPSYGMTFLTNIAIGQQSLEVVLDTGSSDLWVVQAG